MHREFDGAANAKAEQLHQEILEHYFATHPTIATFVGLPDHHDKLRTFAKNSVHEQLAVWSGLRDRCNAIDSALLGPDLRLDHKAVQALVDSEVAHLAEWRPFDRDPGVYVDEMMQGTTFVVTRGKLSLAERQAGLRARMLEFSRVIQEARANLDEPPPLWVDLALDQLDGAEEYLSGLLDAQMAHVPVDQRENEVRANATVLDETRKSIGDFRAFLQRLQSTVTSKDLGVGESLFKTLVWTQHRWRITTDQLNRTGVEGMKAAAAELAHLSTKAGFSGDWRAMIERAAEHHPSPDSLLEVYRNEVRRAQQHIHSIRTLPLPPEDHLDVCETPDFERPLTPVAAYWDPEVFIPKARGKFMVTLPRGDTLSIAEAMRMHTYGAIESTVVHESYPGHQLQVAWAASAKSHIRRVLAISSFAEGWALYSELLMAKTNFFSEDALAYHLRDRLLRAARVLVDVGLQTRRMTFDEAVRLLQDEVGLDEENARSEVAWYSREPTTPLAYHVGMLQILALRQELEQKLGPNFSELEFHRRFLECGTLPIPHVREYIMETWL